MVAAELLKRGFLVGCYPAGNILRFDPAFTIEKEDLQRFLDSLEDVVRGFSTKS